jgi:hypothetical protein
VNASNYTVSSTAYLDTAINNTSNALATNINLNDLNASNYTVSTKAYLDTYINDTINTLAYDINTNDVNVSNYTVSTKVYLDTYINDTINTLAYDINTNDLNASNYTVSTKAYLDTAINNTSNALATNINLNDVNVSNYTLSTTAYLDTYINDTSNNLAQYINIINNNVNDLNADQISQGSSNMFIVNHQYSCNLSILATLTAYNLNVIGTSTTVNTTSYQTENLEIITQAIDGAALKIVQNGVRNIIECFDDTTQVFVLNNAGNVGIGTTEASEKLQVDGNIKFSGNINNISSNTFKYLSDVSSPIQYQIDTNSNLISTRITSLSDTVDTNSNLISTRITSLESNVSNYTSLTSNTIISNIITINTNMSNYMNSVTADHIMNGNNNKYIVNDLYNNNLTINGNVIPASNIAYDLGSSNYKWRDLYLSGNTIYLGTTLISTDSTTKGLVVKDNNNNLVDVTAASVKIKNPNTTSYVELKNINNKVSLVSYNESGNETESTDISLLSTNVSNYVNTTSNQIVNKLNSINTDTLSQGTSNMFITNHEYSNNLRIYGTLTTSNLNIIGATTTITTATYQTENLEIISQATDGPAIKVVQNGTQDIAQFFDTSTNIMTIRKGGNVGIGSTIPSEKIDIIGNIKFTGLINNTSSNEIEYLKGVTSPIQEQINTNSNLISDRITILDSNVSNYVSSISSSTNNGNIVDTSNLISDRITILDSNVSNYVSSISSSTNNGNIVDTSNLISDRITILDSNVSNYVLSSSNSISGKLNTLTTDTLTLGTTNKFIINNEYNNNLTINGTLTANNLNVNGTTTLINTTTYQTENLEIISQATDGPAIKVVQNGTQDIAQFFNGSTNILTIKNGGSVGIGTTDPASVLHTVGSIIATGNVTAYYSDMRLKNKIDDVKEPLKIIEKLHGFYYTANDIARHYGYSNTKTEIGLSAQDVFTVLPEIVSIAPFDTSNISPDITNPKYVSISGENYLTVSYERLAPIFVECIKQLNDEIRSLKAILSGIDLTELKRAE